MQNSISVRGKAFVDDCGRERIFNGVNIVDKNGIYRKEKEFRKTWNDETLARLSSLGFNLIRIGFTWAEIEPEMGKYDEAYLQIIEREIAFCEKYKMYFYLDCHQDLYTGAGQKGFGDGAPSWAALHTPDTAFFKPLAVWAEPYFYGRAVMQSFQSFWENKAIDGIGIQDRFAAMWQMLARRFADSPYCLGFDFLNEPHPGNCGAQVFSSILENSVFLTLQDARLADADTPLPQYKVESKSDFAALLPKIGKFFLRPKFRKAFLRRFQSVAGFHEMVCEALPYIQQFDRVYYTPFVEKMAAAVRSVTDRGILFLENSYFSNLGIPYSAQKPPGEPQVAFAPHGYDIWVDSPLYNHASNARVYSMFREHKRSQERLNVPVLVGEYGGTAVGTRWLSHIDFLTAYFNENKWSSTYWVFTDRLFSGRICRHIARPYPQAVCGSLDSFSHNRETECFFMRYTCEKDYGALQTEVFLYKLPQKIKTDAAYHVKSLSDSTAMLFLDAKPGTHEVTVYF